MTDEPDNETLGRIIRDASPDADSGCAYASDCLWLAEALRASRAREAELTAEIRKLRAQDRLMVGVVNDEHARAEAAEAACSRYREALRECQERATGVSYCMGENVANIVEDVLADDDAAPIRPTQAQQQQFQVAAFLAKTRVENE